VSAALSPSLCVAVEFGVEFAAAVVFAVDDSLSSSAADAQRLP
jgi:hypothetical protein